MTITENIAKSLFTMLAQNTFYSSIMLRSPYDDNDDEISEDDDDFYSPTGNYQGPEETDEDFEERIIELYGD